MTESAAAQARKELRKSISVSWRKGTVKIPAEYPLKVAEMFMEGRNLEGVRTLMGEQQWRAFVDADATASDLQAFMVDAAEAYGLSSGESSASLRSSNGSSPRSKRTS